MFGELAAFQIMINPATIYSEKCAVSFFRPRKSLRGVKKPATVTGLSS
jgi:hypothetical protein